MNFQEAIEAARNIEGANWVAMDQCGEWWAYSEKPTYDAECLHDGCFSPVKLEEGYWLLGRVCNGWQNSLTRITPEE